jgi:hypothetical protein
VEVTVSIRRTIIIHNDVDTFHINPPAKDVGSDKNTLLERLEGGVAFDTIDRDKNTIIPQQLANQLHTVPPGLSPSEY